MPVDFGRTKVRSARVLRGASESSCPSARLGLLLDPMIIKVAVTLPPVRFSARKRRDGRFAQFVFDTPWGMATGEGGRSILKKRKQIESCPQGHPRTQALRVGRPGRSPIQGGGALGDPSCRWLVGTAGEGRHRPGRESGCGLFGLFWCSLRWAGRFLLPSFGPGLGQGCGMPGALARFQKPGWAQGPPIVKQGPAVGAIRVMRITGFTVGRGAFILGAWGLERSRATQPPARRDGRRTLRLKREVGFHDFNSRPADGGRLGLGRRQGGGPCMV